MRGQATRRFLTGAKGHRSAATGRPIKLGGGVTVTRLVDSRSSVRICRRLHRNVRSTTRAYRARGSSYTTETPARARRHEAEYRPESNTASDGAVVSAPFEAIASVTRPTPAPTTSGSAATMRPLPAAGSRRTPLQPPRAEQDERDRDLDVHAASLTWPRNFRQATSRVRHAFITRSPSTANCRDAHRRPRCGSDVAGGVNFCPECAAGPDDRRRGADSSPSCSSTSSARPHAPTALIPGVFIPRVHGDDTHRRTA